MKKEGIFSAGLFKNFRIPVNDLKPQTPKTLFV
jgi:hypothetical protein